MTGPQGPQGDQGPAGTITIGTTSTGPAGSQVVVNNVGTAANAILDFTIPQGAQGVQGDPGLGITFLGNQPNFAAIQEWNAAGVYQKAIALMGRQIDGGE